jgi:hypothetical protein
MSHYDGTVPNSIVDEQWYCLVSALLPAGLSYNLV